MKSSVDFKSTGSGVALIAASKLTSKWFLTCVGEFMSLEVSFSYKLVLADRTSKRSLAGVSPHVGFQITRL